MEYNGLKNKFLHNVSMKEQISEDTSLNMTLGYDQGENSTDLRLKASKYLNAQESQYRNFLFNSASKLSSMFYLTPDRAQLQLKSTHEFSRRFSSSLTVSLEHKNYLLLDTENELKWKIN